jgi:excisionase family DNA binding protein
MPEALLVNVREAAKMLGIGRSKLYELIAAGEIASIRIGAVRRVVVADLTAYIERSLTTQGRKQRGG